jgi:hypothetical protein
VITFRAEEYQKDTPPLPHVLCITACCFSVLAAEGYNKSQGERLCAVMTTSGPGATNLCTGIASAWRDGVPMIVITSQVRVGAVFLLLCLLLSGRIGAATNIRPDESCLEDGVLIIIITSQVRVDVFVADLTDAFCRALAAATNMLHI